MGRSVSGWFEELHFTECFLGEPEWRGPAMAVPVRGVLACAGHPLASEAQPLAGRLVFGAVGGSTRTFYEYVELPGGGTGFHPDLVLIEDGGDGSGAALTEYRFGGVREDPRGWLEWTVRALSFEFELCAAQA